jgi:murein DD-endopeptidase MepM/ murein hydrolase activator NlpD
MPFMNMNWRRITQKFGVRNPIYKNGRHDGLDVSTGGVEGLRLGNPLTEGGEIIRAGVDGSSGGFGNFIAIRGLRGGVVLIAHLQHKTPWYRAMLYRLPGTGRIAYGQYIGSSGNTGYSTGPHVHIQCTLGSRFEDLFTAPVDPIVFFAIRG